jgi:Domain of unknown function (DUF4082)
VPITAGTVYTVSYHAPSGHYSADELYFNNPVDSAPLHAPAGTNGTYRYGSTAAFPTSSYRATNYWVDVNFTSTNPAGGSSFTASTPTAPTSLAIAAAMSQAIDPTSGSDPSS